MSNKLSKFSANNFEPKHKMRRLSLATRIEVMRKRHLVKKAKQLLENGLNNKPVTPLPASYEESFKRTINMEVLSELMEKTKEKKKKQAIEYKPPEKKLDSGIFTDSESDNISENECDNESDNVSDNTSDIEKYPLIAEVPELVDI
jgi:hypothetical protein